MDSNFDSLNPNANSFAPHKRDNFQGNEVKEGFQQAKNRNHVFSQDHRHSIPNQQTAKIPQNCDPIFNPAIPPPKTSIPQVNHQNDAINSTALEPLTVYVTSYGSHVYNRSIPANTTEYCELLQPLILKKLDYDGQVIPPTPAQIETANNLFNVRKNTGEIPLEIFVPHLGRKVDLIEYFFKYAQYYYPELGIGAPPIDPAFMYPNYYQHNERFSDNSLNNQKANNFDLNPGMTQQASNLVQPVAPQQSKSNGRSNTQNNSFKHKNEYRGNNSNQYCRRQRFNNDYPNQNKQ